QRGGADRVRLDPGVVAAAPGILYLSEQPAVLGLNGVRPALEAVQVVVVPCPHPVRHVLMPRHADRLSDDERRAPARASGMIADQSIGHARVAPHVRIHGRMHDAVAEAIAGQLERGKQRGTGCRHRQNPEGVYLRTATALASPCRLIHWLVWRVGRTQTPSHSQRGDHMLARNNITRRDVLKMAGAAGGLAVTGGIRGAWAQGARRIEQLDPGLSRILSTSQTIQELGSGYGGALGPAEGPVWWKEGGYLLFSDIHND